MKPELMAVIFGLIVALFALIVKLMHSSAERKSNLNSVKPILEIKPAESESQSIKIILKNVGVGTAFIESFEAVIHNTSYPVNSKKLFDSVLNHLGLNGLDVICCAPEKGEKMEVNESRNLFEANPVNKTEYDKIASAISKLSFKIKYKSIYGESFILG
jgi:hypothetical protein